jgi:hypothetical protein
MRWMISIVTFKDGKTISAVPVVASASSGQPMLDPVDVNPCACWTTAIIVTRPQKGKGGRLSLPGPATFRAVRREWTQPPLLGQDVNHTPCPGELQKLVRSACPVTRAFRHHGRRIMALREAVGSQSLS